MNSEQMQQLFAALAQNQSATSEVSRKELKSLVEAVVSRQSELSVDTKLFRNIEKFSGLDSHWEEFKFHVEAAASMMNFAIELKDAALQGSDFAGNLEDMTDPTQVKSKMLYYLLAQACKGKAHKRYQTMCTW